MRGRVINVILCTMRILNPLFCLVVQVFSICQEEKFSMIIKTFVTLGLVSSIDNMFTGNLPQAIKDNAAKLNSSGSLRMSEDRNTFKKMLIRLKISKNYTRFFTTCVINVLWWLIINCQVIFVNYFTAFICIIVQYVGYVY